MLDNVGKCCCKAFSEVALWTTVNPEWHSLLRPFFSIYRHLFWWCTFWWCLTCDIISTTIISGIPVVNKNPPKPWNCDNSFPLQEIALEKFIFFTQFSYISWFLTYFGQFYCVRCFALDVRFEISKSILYFKCYLSLYKERWTKCYQFSC